MALKFTYQQINNLIDVLKKNAPYNKNDEETNEMDDRSNGDNGRETATKAKRLLDGYFKLYPEEDIYGYLDGSCFNKN